ncbi:peptidoglycan DD-metalloendopeptidase family protein [Flavonifractor sp. An100]|uniref:murein hydrolase activator EnvC family protein n=1 Tax=Flavonifractor sp. An100 TaxID=1965538 RepID=UPI000B36886B|nr:peptidoglycan DD-metalloendopeptidase family protein [Flavonifractor sp. An100]OUQ82404.1 peptidase M23 [Flavonifractor sp. An100]
MNRQKKRSMVSRLLALMLVAALVVPLSGQVLVMPASAVTQAEINDLKDDAAALDAEKKALQEQLKAVQADKSAAQQKKSLIEQQMNVIQAEIDNITAQINSYNDLIAQKEAELAEAEAEEEKQYDLFCQRVRLMEEEGEVSYWSILFSSSDFNDLLDSFMMVEEFIEYDNALMEQILALQAQIEEDKSQLEQAKADQEAAKAKQVAAKEELAAQEAEVDKLIAQISSQEDELEAAEAKLKAAANAMDAEIKRLEKELAAQISNVVSESGFLWPLDGGYNTISSLFGSRPHPLTGKPNNHTGIDIPAPRNTKIYAAKSGVVITSTYNSSYGNYVVVSHSDGTSTLYAHMNKRNATVGQTVKQGAVIGYVGTTGSSTGNHLHFEIRLNGNRVDPIDYFKDKTLYVTSGGKKVLLEH